MATQQHSRHVPVTMGSPRFHSMDAGRFSVTEAWFAPNDVLHSHTHERPILGIMLSGDFETRIAGRVLSCPHASAWVEPATEHHANHIGAGGAHVLVVQPHTLGCELFAPFRETLDTVVHVRSAELAAYAFRLAEELRLDDNATPLAMHGLVLTIMASLTRARAPAASARAAPAWLYTVRELLHDRFRERIELEDVARAAGVHPSHLARAFRRRFGVTIGEYVRRLRVEWAADRLARTDLSLPEIATSAGFADQSHFARQLKQRLGLTPAQYRRECRGRR